MNRRSKFDISNSYKTSFNVGDLIPFHYEEVLPGDTFSIDTNILCRMQPLVTPIMDDVYLDVYYFFVPNRIVWDHWKEFMGENTTSAWYPTTEYNVPHVKVDSAHSPGFGTCADYFGIPINQPNAEFTYSQLPFRAYAEIWNEWFRDENLQDPVLVDKGDSDVPYSNQTTYGGSLLKVNKYHDYFTSCLPEPQKGPDVTLPIQDYAPVYSVDPVMVDSLKKTYPVVENYVTPTDGSTADQVKNLNLQTGEIVKGSHLSMSTGSKGIDSGRMHVAFSNLIADLNATTSATINSLRLALATQSFYEKNARGGTRYRELLKSHFNVTSPDGRQQVPELLNYNRIDININQVVQNSASTDDSPLARQAAYCLTADADNSFTKSFTEHGMVIGVMCARYKHSYYQGLNKRFSRRTMFDYYFPVFANLGEQPVLNKEIYVGAKDKNEEVFGYQEAYADYRYHPDIFTSEMRCNYPQSLDVWHLGDNYESLPSLSPSWIQEDKSIMDRVLVVSSKNSNQLFCDMYIKNTAVRVMPMFSIPGLPRTL
nr:MAG TPA: Major capsid protein [Microviridae sp.]